MGVVGPASRSRQPGNPHVFRSLQRIVLPDVSGAFESWGQPDGLAKMMRAYFSVAERCAARLVRVRWTGSRPTIFLAWPPVVMIAMGEATFELNADRRAIGVAIEGGLLVMPTARPHLEIALARRPGDPVAGDLEASVDLWEYQPRFGQSAIVRWVYAHTQVPVHVWVGNTYLRQLRREWGG